MASVGEGIGMMDEAYFVSRGELLQWLNSTLDLNYTKVEQVCSGAAFCQLMDLLYPGKVRLSKVNFAAKHEYEYIKNFKVLQDVFDKLDIKKAIDVNKLIKGKYQDNLEMFQWMKRYFELHYNGANEYDASSRRAAAISKHESDKAGGSASHAAVANAIAVGSGGSAPDRAAKRETVVGPGAPKSTPASVTRAKSAATKTTPSSTPSTGRADASAQSEKVRELERKYADKCLQVESLEKERDFYFGKLRDIEIRCQEADAASNPIIAEIQKILYATDDEYQTQEQPEQGGEMATDA